MCDIKRFINISKKMYDTATKGGKEKNEQISLHDTFIYYEINDYF